MINDKNRKRLIILTILLFLIIIISWSIYLLIPRSYIKFYTSPEQVVVLINKHRHVIQTEDIITVNPGKYNIIVFKDEFNPYEKSIQVKNGETYDFYADLLALTDKAAESKKGDNADKVGEIFYTEQSSYVINIINIRYPIVNIMPIQAKYYTLSICKSEKYKYDPTAVAICADIYPPYDQPGADIKELVMKDLRWRDIEPDNQEIIWNEIKN